MNPPRSPPDDEPQTVRHNSPARTYTGESSEKEQTNQNAFAFGQVLDPNPESNTVNVAPPISESLDDIIEGQKKFSTPNNSQPEAPTLSTSPLQNCYVS